LRELISTGQGPREGCGKLPGGVRQMIFFRRGAHLAEIGSWRAFKAEKTAKHMAVKK